MLTHEEQAHLAAEAALDDLRASAWMRTVPGFDARVDQVLELVGHHRVEGLRGLVAETRHSRAKACLESADRRRWAIVRSWLPWVGRTARSVSSDPDAESIALEVAFEATCGWDGSRPWAAVARGRIRDRLRRRHRSTGERGVEDLGAPAPQLDDLLGRELLDRVEALAATLTPHQRRVARELLSGAHRSAVAAAAAAGVSDRTARDVMARFRALEEG